MKVFTESYSIILHVYIFFFFLKPEQLSKNKIIHLLCPSCRICTSSCYFFFIFLTKNIFLSGNVCPILTASAKQGEKPRISIWQCICFFVLTFETALIYEQAQTFWGTKMGPGVRHTLLVCWWMTGGLGKWQNWSQEGIKHVAAAVTGSLLWVHARDFKSWSSPGIPWTCLCFAFCCCCFFSNHGSLLGFAVLLHLFLVPSESNCEYLLISCLEGIWIFNHYYHPFSSLFYCIYVVLLV